MKKEYRIRDGAAPTEAELRRYRDFGKLVYQHQRMTRPLYKRPLYRDPRALLVIIVIALLAVLIAQEVEKEEAPVKAPEPPTVDGGLR